MSLLNFFRFLLCACGACFAVTPLKIAYPWDDMQNAANYSRSSSQDLSIDSAIFYYKLLGYAQMVVPAISNDTNDASFASSLASEFVCKNGLVCNYFPKGSTEKSRYSSGKMFSALRAIKGKLDSAAIEMIPELPIKGIQYRKINIRAWGFETQNQYDSFMATTYANDPGRKNSEMTTGEGIVAPTDTFAFIYGQLLRVIKNAYGHSPKYISIGGDEPGFPDLLVKQGKMKNDPRTASQLYAKLITIAVDSIKSIMGDSVKVLMWGDAVLPTHNGTAYGMVGDDSGKGSVLEILKQAGLANTVILVPWAYSIRDGDRIGYRDYPFSRYSEIQFAGKFGFSVVAGAGEGGIYDKSNAAGLCEQSGAMGNETESNLQWMIAGNKYPNIVVGYMHILWNQFRNSGEYCKSGDNGYRGYLPGFSAPIVSYFGWQDGGRALSLLSRHAWGVVLNKMYPRMVRNVNARERYQWRNGEEYFSPPSHLNLVDFP